MSALPTLLLIPLYHKIRIPYEDVLASVYDFDGFLGINRKAIGSTVFPEIEWDIRISDINELKVSFGPEAPLTQRFAPDVDKLNAEISMAGDRDKRRRADIRYSILGQ